MIRELLAIAALTTLASATQAQDRGAWRPWDDMSPNAGPAPVPPAPVPTPPAVVVQPPAPQNAVAPAPEPFAIVVESAPAAVTPEPQPEPAAPPVVVAEQAPPVAPPVSAETPVATAMPGLVAATTVGAPMAGRGQVVFFRPSKLGGAALSFSIRENKRPFVKLGNGSYAAFDVEPGAHAFSVQGEVEDVLHLEIDEGQTYYVRHAIGLGIVLGRPNLAPVDEAAFQKGGRMRLAKPTAQAAD